MVFIPVIFKPTDLLFHHFQPANLIIIFETPKQMLFFYGLFTLHFTTTFRPLQM